MHTRKQLGLLGLPILLLLVMAGGAGAALPTVTSGTLVFDVNPDVTSFTVGQSVTTLTDQSASALTLTGTAPNVPTLATNVFGTHNALVNTGAQALASASGIAGAASGGYTVFSEHTLTLNSNNQKLFADNMQVFAQGPGATVNVYSPGSGFSAVTGAIATAPAQMLEYVLNGTSSTSSLYRNGYAVGTTGAYTDQSLSGAMSIGDSSLGWIGNLGRLLIYRGVLNATDRAAVEASLETTYGVGAPALPANTIAASDSHIFYSPYNWRTVTEPTRGLSEANTVQTGAYLKTIFSGTSLGLAFDPTPVAQKAATVNYPVIRCVIDGLPPIDVQETAAGGTVPVIVNLPSGNHALTATVVRMDNAVGDWLDAAGICNCVRFQGLVLDSAATLTSPGLRSRRAVYFGDSITAGVRALANDASVFFTGTDGTVTAATLLCNRLDAECGIIGTPSQGFETGGSGGRTTFPQAWNFIQSGISQPFSPAPDYLFENEERNGGTTQADVTNWLTAARTLLPSTKIFCLCNAGGNISGYVNTYKTATGDALTYNVPYTQVNASPGANSFDGLHPTVAGHQAAAEALISYFQTNLAAAATILPQGYLPTTGTKRRLQ